MKGDMRMVSERYKDSIKSCYHKHTHVLIQNPTEGYGILAENMLKTAREARAELS